MKTMKGWYEIFIEQWFAHRHNHNLEFFYVAWLTINRMFQKKLRLFNNLRCRKVSDKILTRPTKSASHRASGHYRTTNHGTSPKVRVPIEYRFHDSISLEAFKYKFSYTLCGIFKMLYVLPAWGFSGQIRSLNCH